jgi:hypothetical protein
VSGRTEQRHEPAGCISGASRGLLLAENPIEAEGHALTVPPDELTGDETTVRVLATTGSGTTIVRTDTMPVR